LLQLSFFGSDVTVASLVLLLAFPGLRVARVRLSAPVFSATKDFSIRDFARTFVLCSGAVTGVIFSTEFFSLPSALLFAPRGTAQHRPVIFSSCSLTPMFPVCGTDAFSLDSFPCACLGLVQLSFLISSRISLSLSGSTRPGALPLVPAPAVADLVRVLVLCFGVCHDLSSAAQICFGFKC
jgi:hypothetical protein